MIGKISRNHSFQATVAYVLEKPGSVLADSNMVMANSATTSIVSEFRIAQHLNEAIQRPVYHVSLSLPPSEKLNIPTLGKLASTYLERMGFNLETNQYLSVVHTDREHLHVHIVANRIDTITGKAVELSHDYYKSQSIIRDLEQEFELIPVPSSWERGKRESHPLERLPHPTEHTLDEEQPFVSARTRLQQMIDEAIALLGDGTTLSEFSTHLMEQGVGIRLSEESADQAALPNRNDKTRNPGISFAFDGVAIAGHKLGSAYSLKGLQQRGIHYKAARDIPAIQSMREQAIHIRQSLPVLLRLWGVLDELNTPL